MALSVMGGTRTPNHVAAYIRVLLREQHDKAVADGKTVHPLPSSLQLTQSVSSSESDSDSSDSDSD